MSMSSSYLQHFHDKSVSHCFFKFHVHPIQKVQYTKLKFKRMSMSSSYFQQVHDKSVSPCFCFVSISRSPFVIIHIRDVSLPSEVRCLYQAKVSSKVTKLILFSVVIDRIHNQPLCLTTKSQHTQNTQLAEIHCHSKRQTEMCPCDTYRSNGHCARTPGLPTPGHPEARSVARGDPPWGRSCAATLRP